MTGLATLEQALALVAGHDLIVEPLLGAGEVQVVVDDVVAERAARDRPLLERGYRLAQRRRKALGIGFVGVALEGRGRLELLLDPVEPRRDQGGKGEVRVDVAAGDARLDPRRRPVSDDPEAARAVVVTPGESRRRPRARGIALVGVDVRREEDRELTRVRDPAGEKAVEQAVVVGKR